MENASDALRMAAGLLIALLLISLLIYMFSQVSTAERGRDENRQVAERSEFNNKFNAFDKSSMYGTDLISVLGLAISNNKIYNQSKMANPDGRYDENTENTINIRFILNKEVKQTTTTITYELDNTTGELVETKRENAPGSVAVKLKPDIPYSLEVTGTNTSILEVLDMIAVQGNTTVVLNEKWSNGGRKLERTIQDTSGFDDMKKGIFECTDVGYDQSGRINCMTFSEKDDSNR